MGRVLNRVKPRSNLGGANRLPQVSRLSRPGFRPIPVRLISLMNFDNLISTVFVSSLPIRAKSVADFPKSPENCATPKPSHNIVFNVNTRPYRAQENLSGVVRCTTKTGAGAQRRHP
jgi:hypothetical protein